MAAQELLVFAGERLGQQARESLVRELLDGPAEEELGGGVRIPDRPALVHQDDRVRQVLEQGGGGYRPVGLASGDGG